MRRDILFPILLSIGLIASICVLYVARTLVLVALIGIGFGVIFSPIVEKMRRKLHLPAGVGAFLIVLLILSGFVAVGYGLFLLISDQAKLLVEQAPKLIESLGNEASAFFKRYPWIEKHVGRQDLGKAARDTVATLFQGLQLGVSAMIGSILVLTMAIYVAIRTPAYLQGLLSVFPAYYRPRAKFILKSSADELRKWIKAHLIVVSITGLLTGLSLWLLGIDYWLLLGVLTAVLDFIPYLGPLMVGFATTLVTLASVPDKVFWVIGAFLLIQQLESDLIVPLIMKEGVQLPEAHLIILIIFMGNFFGIIGVFAAPPLLAVTRKIYLLTYCQKMNQISRRQSEIHEFKFK